MRSRTVSLSSLSIASVLAGSALAQPEPFYPRVNLTGWPHPGGCSANYTDSTIFNPFWADEHRMGVVVKPGAGWHAGCRVDGGRHGTPPTRRSLL
ncbi:MAG: hypothetical protein IPK69_13560 [Phycisphaerales bacterium]|nr:MAG: hypothetical protein IPK69_13560 [Phycisphaerales bacterium]